MKRKFLNILMLTVAIQLLQGCVLAGLGALGGAGYYVGTKAGKREEERIKTQSLIEVKRELEEKDTQAKAQDQDITNQINQNYLAGALSGGIAVYPEVRNGVVILHGRVPDAATAERAIAAARKTTGVQRIISNLVILNQPAQQQARPAANQMPANVPQQYQQQYQQFMQQYQQPPIQAYPQIQMQPQPIQLQDPSQPPRIKYEQLFNYRPESEKQQLAGKSNNLKPQVYHKAQARQQKQSPPRQSVNNSKTKSVTQVSRSSSKLSPDQNTKYNSDDNDSAYKEYRPRKINRNKTVTRTTPQQKEVIFVPVPVPSYAEDNDNSYRGLGGYNPHPIGYGNQNHDAPIAPSPQIPVPAVTEDNDFQYYD